MNQTEPKRVKTNGSDRAKGSWDQWSRQEEKMRGLRAPPLEMEAE